jgi:hypothetical protein
VAPMRGKHEEVFYSFLLGWTIRCFE